MKTLLSLSLLAGSLLSQQCQSTPSSSSNSLVYRRVHVGSDLQDIPPVPFTYADTWTVAGQSGGSFATLDITQDFRPDGTYTLLIVYSWVCDGQSPVETAFNLSQTLSWGGCPFFGVVEMDYADTDLPNLGPDPNDAYVVVNTPTNTYYPLFYYNETRSPTQDYPMYSPPTAALNMSFLHQVSTAGSGGRAWYIEMSSHGGATVPTVVNGPVAWPDFNPDLDWNRGIYDTNFFTNAGPAFVLVGDQPSLFVIVPGFAGHALVDPVFGVAPLPLSLPSSLLSAPGAVCLQPLALLPSGWHFGRAYTF